MGYFDLVVDTKSRYQDALYTYESEMPLEAGQIVRVPFHKNNRLRTACVFRTGVLPEEGINYKKVAETDPCLSLNEEMVETCSWMRSRYGIRYIDAVRCFLPPGKPPAPGKEKEPYKNTEGEPQYIENLTDEQKRAVDTIAASMETGAADIFLLHGVTSSGKTEVYMRLVERALARGKTAIMLVPEISLTDQILERFTGRFGKDKIAVLHSKLTGRERFDEWMRLRTGKARICIGARIGVFAPLSDIGIIIMDEEHENTYKSDQNPKYDTVDVAAKRLLTTKGVLVLGSATPSVVSYQRALEGTYRLIEMKKRFNETPLPDIRLVDMREELRQGNRSVFSRPLYEAIKRNLAENRQIILFQNRRGYSTFVACRDCGEALKCPDCGITLVYHKSDGMLHCHYCGRKFPVPERCPVCGSQKLKGSGTGTEKVEEGIQNLFPDASLERLDLDTVKNRGEIKRIIRSFSKGKTDILIGTQLVAKGLDFRNVGLVGVVSADVTLNIPDYRSTERTFQLVTQVSGRAGRGENRGEVIVQSYTPENFALQAAARQDYAAFFDQEIKVRSLMGYPPFSDLIAAEFTSEDEETARESAEECRRWLARTGLPGSDRIFLPVKTQNFIGKDSFRYHILIKCPRGYRNKYVQYLKFYGDKLFVSVTGVSMMLDINPYGTL